MKRQRDGQIDSLAQEIYGLVWANRDGEAEKRLRDLGPDVVPVAHTLVVGNFRWPPLLLRLGNAGQWLMVCGPLLIPVIYSIFWDVPLAYFDHKWLFYFALAGGAIITELFSAALIPSLVNTFRFVKMREEANQRKLRIACAVLIDNSADHPEMAPAILDAMDACNCTYMEPSTPIDLRLEAVLESTLQTCKPEVLDGLSREQRQTLYYKLRRIRERLKHGYAIADDDNIDVLGGLGVAIIRSYLHLPCEDGIPLVKRIAETETEGVDPRWTTLVQCAADLLPEMEERLRRSQGKEVLLRASNAVKNGETELLRAHTANGVMSAEEFLRPTDDIADKY